MYYDYEKMKDKYNKMIEDDLIQHQKQDGCNCPIICPNSECNACSEPNRYDDHTHHLAYWDMGMEGHYCSKDEYYDGLK